VDRCAGGGHPLLTASNRAHCPILFGCELAANIREKTADSNGFILELFGSKGAPLAVRVLFTWLVADFAFGSVMMGRWEKKEAETA